MEGLPAGAVGKLAREEPSAAVHPVMLPPVAPAGAEPAADTRRAGAAMAAAVSVSARAGPMEPAAHLPAELSAAAGPSSTLQWISASAEKKPAQASSCVRSSADPMPGTIAETC